MKTLAGFHAVKGRLKQGAGTVHEIYVDAAVLGIRGWLSGWR